MPFTKLITSVQNPQIRNISLLAEKSRTRKEQGLFVAEGLREVRLALEAGFVAQQLLWCPDDTPAEILHKHIKPEWLSASDAVEVSPAVFEKIALRGGVPNVVAVLESRKLSPSQLTLKPNPFLLIVESVEKPGNLGAMLRTADAAGVDAVIFCDPQTDLWNPNCIRASLGAVFSVPVAEAPTADVIKWLKENKINTYVSYLEASHPYIECDFVKGTAIVMGSEAEGISEAWLQAGFERIIIPMAGHVDSMNVSASAAILMFEVCRQRNFSHA